MNRLLTKNIKRLAVTAGNFLLTNAAYAQGITLENPEDISTKILCPIARWMFGILISLSVIMVLVGGYMYLTAGGDSEKVSKATKTITYAAIGVAVAIIARGFPILIGSIFPGVSGIRSC